MPFLRPPLFRVAGGMSLFLFCCTLFCDLPSSEWPGVCRSFSSVALYFATSPLQRGRGYVALSLLLHFILRPPLFRGAGVMSLSLLLHFILRPPLFRGAGVMSLFLFCCTLFCDLPSSEGPGVCRSPSSVALYFATSPLQRGRGYVALSLLLHFILRPPLFRGAGVMSLSLFCCTLSGGTIPSL